MEPDRWKQIESLCHRALDLDPNERAKFLDTACENDPQLRREVEDLLKHAGCSDLLARPTEELANLVKDLVSHTLVIGTRVAGYSIDAVLGAGGMGQVYRARDTKLNRSVAIKFLSRPFGDDSARRRFEQEARMASALNHP